MRLDPVIAYCMKLLCEPISLLGFHIEPDDDEDNEQVQFAAQAQKLLKWTPGITNASYNLLDEGIFVGRAGQQVRWQNVWKRDRTWMLPTGFEPIQGDKLVFGFDGRVGVRVGGNYVGPSEQVRPTDFSRAYFPDAAEREQLIVHCVHPTDASFWQPTKAGQLYGRGLRDELYWLWALKQKVWGMSMDFLAWFAKGLTVFFFQGGNDEHRQEMQTWIEGQDGNTSMLMPWWPTVTFDPIRRFEASTASPAFIQELVTKYFDELIKLVIVGQTLTSGTGPTGLGSGTAQAHQLTFDNRVKFHSTALDETKSRDILGPFYRANKPGMPIGHWVSDIDDPNAQQSLDNAERIYGMGGQIGEEPLLEIAGLEPVKPGQTILTNVQGMQPAATDQTPLGVSVQEPQGSGTEAH